jgi:hypothetical protein
MFPRYPLFHYIGYGLWLVGAVAFDWIEGRVFHTNTGIGLMLGFIIGGLAGFAMTRIKISK